MGKYLYLSASKKKKKMQTYTDTEQKRSLALLPRSVVLEVQSSGQQQQLVEMRILRPHPDLLSHNFGRRTQQSVLTALQAIF